MQRLILKSLSLVALAEIVACTCQEIYKFWLFGNFRFLKTSVAMPDNILRFFFSFSCVSRTPVCCVAIGEKVLKLVPQAQPWTFRQEIYKYLYKYLSLWH